LTKRGECHGAHAWVSNLYRFGRRSCRGAPIREDERELSKTVEKYKDVIDVEKYKIKIVE
jgi:hypothetical protein